MLRAINVLIPTCHPYTPMRRCLPPVERDLIVVKWSRDILPCILCHDIIRASSEWQRPEYTKHVYIVVQAHKCQTTIHYHYLVNN